MDIEQARALVEHQARAWERADVDAVLADFAPDGVLISPMGRWQGHQALREIVGAFFATGVTVTIAITRVLLDGDTGAAEWTWDETNPATGHHHSVDDGIIFVLDGEKLRYWREYFDTAVTR